MWEIGAKDSTVWASSQRSTQENRVTNPTEHQMNKTIKKAAKEHHTLFLYMALGLRYEKIIKDVYSAVLHKKYPFMTNVFYTASY